MKSINIDNTVNDFLERFVHFVNVMNDNLLHFGRGNIIIGGRL